MKHCLASGILALVLFPFSLCGGDLTALTNLEGIRIEAEVLALQDDKVEVMYRGNKTSIPLNKLDEASRAAVTRALDEREKDAAVATAGRMELPDGQKIVPEKLLTFILDATDQERKWVKNDLLQKIQVTVAFPPGFDPGKSWPVFFTNGTTLGANADVVKSFKTGGNECGYVVLGAHAVGITEENKLGWWDCRGLVTQRAIRELAKNWPGILQSDWYFGGNSGGAKNCCYLAVYLHEVLAIAPAGFFLSACNEMKMTDAIESYRSKEKVFRNAAFFVSNGKKDKIAPPAKGEEVVDLLKRAGFRNVRFEVHESGHGMNQQHCREALQWFTQLRNGREISPGEEAD